MKLRLAQNTPLEERNKMPSVWESVIPYFNHSELEWVNAMARKCGVAEKLPFLYTEKLGFDTGERFFSEYIQWMRAEKPAVNEYDMCLCRSCYNNTNVEACAPVLVSWEESDINNKETIQESTISNVTNNIGRLTNSTTLQITQQPIFVFLPPPPGFFLPPPTYQPMVCCERYRCWFETPNRRGRAPHDYHCRVQSTPNQFVI